MFVPRPNNPPKRSKNSRCGASAKAARADKTPTRAGRYTDEDFVEMSVALDARDKTCKALKGLMAQIEDIANGIIKDEEKFWVVCRDVYTALERHLASAKPIVPDSAQKETTLWKVTITHYYDDYKLRGNDPSTCDGPYTFMSYERAARFFCRKIIKHLHEETGWLKKIYKDRENWYDYEWLSAWINRCDVNKGEFVPESFDWNITPETIHGACWVDEDEDTDSVSIGSESEDEDTAEDDKQTAEKAPIIKGG